MLLTTLILMISSDVIEIMLEKRGITCQQVLQMVLLRHIQITMNKTLVSISHSHPVLSGHMSTQQRYGDTMLIMNIAFKK